MVFSMDAVADQTGRVVMITGCSSGIGYETALAVAKKGATVVMACRNLEKANTARNLILMEAPRADLETLQVDLTDLASVRSAAQEFRAKHDTLDVLINNAGIMMPPYAVTSDGFESQMAANCFGHFLLTSLLLDLMPDKPESRITWLSSGAHKSGQIDFDDINAEKKYSAMKAYSQSKLACLMYAIELNKRLRAAGKKILSNASHPGISPHTQLSRNMPRIIHLLLAHVIIRFMSHSNEQGAMPSLEAAISPSAEGGQYYGPQGFKESKGPSGVATIASQALDAGVSKRLWDLSESLTAAEFSL